MIGSNGVFEVVPGLNHRNEHVFSVIVKRSYRISDGHVERADVDQPLRMIDRYYDNGDPEWATVQYESELAPYKASTDVVVIGKAGQARVQEHLNNLGDNFVMRSET